MSPVQMLLVVGTAALVNTAVLAADLPQPPVYAPPVEGGWYLRGYIGQSNQFLNSISHPSFATAAQFEFLDKGGFDSAPFY